MPNPFEMWFYNATGKKEDVTQAPSEKQFFDVVKVKIKSLQSFVAWLVLKKHIKGFIDVKGEKPVALISLPTEKKIAYLVKNLKNIKDLAKEFNKANGDIENKKDE